ncbi:MULTISPECIES: shikimate dehydrogenase [unclassified Modestobacter]|uniref:shikimate dehydrogenase n=1 Tax=unclassified Modestobacter TaxID=2643866 RepID=UPI0022AB37F4|nr:MULTISPECIES: shikimate dehydrogenase [unclassified Modestobacter]MCZ2826881.1 shikimate dehydrogenase [Modestobacter sp. VKM Ac-2981]MCZ2855423.1 shikimate dehydrogenase [Modestobacter sp. VKM Ac-2982]
MTGSAPQTGAPAPRRSFLAGLLGQGIGPSLSPELHEREGARQGLRYTYKTVELPDDALQRDHLRRLLRAAVELGFDGLNVTHPVKQVMAPLVDDLAPEAAAIGAINTIVIEDGRTRGHNTDVTGFAAALQAGLPGVGLERVVLIGAGGAGGAVAHALVGQGVQQLSVVDRDAVRAEQLIGALAAAGSRVPAAVFPPEELPGLLAGASGLVNATPMGMAAHPGTPVPVDLLRADLWVADIVYRPLLTQLVREATALGCRVMTGAGMAVNQAADSFELFIGRAAARPAMFADFDELVAAEIDGDAPTPDPARPLSQTHPTEH